MCFRPNCPPEILSIAVRMSQYLKQECEELHANSMISFDSRRPKAQDSELATRALRVLLRQQFDDHFVLARTEVPRQDAGFEERLSPPGRDAIAVTALRLVGARPAGNRVRLRPRSRQARAPSPMRRFLSCARRGAWHVRPLAGEREKPGHSTTNGRRVHFDSGKPLRPGLLAGASKALTPRNWRIISRLPSFPWASRTILPSLEGGT